MRYVVVEWTGDYPEGRFDVLDTRPPEPQQAEGLPGVAQPILASCQARETADALAAALNGTEEAAGVIAELRQEIEGLKGIAAHEAQRAQEAADPERVAILATWYSLFCVLMDGPDGPDLKRLLALRQELIREAPELEAKFLAGRGVDESA